MPGSNVEWVVAAANPLMFSVIDHTNTGATQSYQINSSEYDLEDIVDPLHVSAAGSIYFISKSRSDTTKAYVTRIAAIGDTSSETRTIADTASQTFQPFGVRDHGTDLIVGVIREDTSITQVGIVTYDASMNYFGRFAAAAGR